MVVTLECPDGENPIELARKVIRAYLDKGYGLSTYHHFGSFNWEDAINCIPVEDWADFGIRILNLTVFADVVNYDEQSVNIDEQFKPSVYSEAEFGLL